MTWTQYYIDFMVLLIREGGSPRDIAPIFSVSPAAIYALLRARSAGVKKLGKMPPFPQKDRNRIIREFCKSPSNLEKLRSILHSYGIRFEDFKERSFSGLSGHIDTILGRSAPVLSERNKEIAELRRGGMTLKAISLRYGISRERVRQVILQFNKNSDNPVDIEKARISSRCLSPERLERQNKIVELCRSGLTSQQIADTLGIEKSHVFQDIIRHNRTAESPLRFHRTYNRKITDEVREIIIQERKKGTTNYVLAERFGVAYGTICLVLKAAGLTRPLRTYKRTKRKKTTQTPVKKQTAKKKKASKRARR